MKKLVLIPALLTASLAFATEYNYEITPQIGYNIAEGNIELDDYGIIGGEFQYNGFDSVIKPEVSILYSKADYSVGSADTSVTRIALNGVYEFDKVGFFTPLAKAGLGYETMGDAYTAQTGNTDSAFLDAGIGAKVPFNDMFALKLEAVYMMKYNDARYDSNLAILAGLTIAFGEKAQKVAPVAAAAAVVVLDGDNDGVVDADDKCPTSAAGANVDTTGCLIVLDGDNDGVADADDKCPTSAKDANVDATGCVIVLDADKDGITDAKDICPNTPLGEAVNSDGCPDKIILKVQFENDSFDVTPASHDMIQKYADFLSANTNYSAKIVGHTDSRGSAAYNQKLSAKRAAAVEAMIIEKGVDAKQLSTSGAGEADPIADNATSEGRAENRRIEAELTRN